MNFLNDSLKSLKNVLAEGLDTKVGFDDDSIAGTSSAVHVINPEHENLKKLCQHQSEEIAVLRKQIFDYQQAKLSDISSNSKTLLDATSQQQPQQSQNDSWFWEPESSSTSSKKGDNGSPAFDEAEIDLTTIPLDVSDHDLMEKLRQSTARLRILGAENAELNEKLKNASVENQELNRNIEELDKQHQIAIEKILDVKRSLQDKLNDELKAFEVAKSDLVKENQKLREELDEELISHKEIVRDYEMQIDELSEANLRLENEISSEPEVIASNDESLRRFNALVNQNFKINENFEDEESLARWLTVTAGKLRELDFEISKLVDENKLIKEESAKHANERDALKAELVNYEIECSELMKNNNILMADIESLKCGGKLETIMENDEELERQLEDSNTLNQNLEDEFQSIRSKLEETEVERSEYFGEIQQLKNQLAENVSRCKKYQEEIDNLENEKSNYLFELNELKSEEERNILQRELKFVKDREFELNEKFVTLEKEHNALKEKFSSSDEKHEKDLEISSTLDSVRSQLSALEKEKAELVKEVEEKQRIEARCDELEKVNAVNLANLKKSNEIVQDLQKKILEAEAKISELDEKESQLSEMLEGARREIELAKNKTAEKDLEIQQNSSDLVTAKQEISSLQNDLLTLQQQKDELTTQIGALEAARVSFETRCIELEKINEENSKKFDETVQNLQSNVSDSQFSEALATLESVKSELSSTQQTNNDLTEQLKSLQTRCDDISKSNDDYQQKLQEASAKILSLDSSLMALAKEKEDLIALVTTKHNENVQYHNEIVRLNQLMQQQDSTKAEVESMNDQIKFLREKCDLLATNLLQEQNSLRLLQQEKNDAVELNITLNKDIERLRQHLLEVADAYTFEQVSLQKQVEEYKNKLMAIETEAKQSATAYTSANIRANQQAETLQTQYNLLAQQRDELMAKLGAAEDNDNKNQAALTNLQVALEIFQRDKERDVELRTSTILKQLEEERKHQAKLTTEIHQLQQQLQEAKNGLMAAARLSDQLELNQLTIERLNNEITSYQNTNQSLKQKLEESNANTSNADIDLIKNLVIGYISAPNATAKTQILKLISNVLNLNDAECSRIGLRSSGGSGVAGWFSRGGSDSVNNNVSLTEAFVAFLEKESQPRVNSANLLTIHETETTAASRKQSMTGDSPDPNENPTSSPTDVNPVPILLGENSLLTPYNNRNSSTILKDLLHDT